MANGRLYAIRFNGGRSGHPFLPGWPVKIGIIDAGLLPDVGEGINGSPVVAPLRCPVGGIGEKIAVTPDAGPAYVLNPDGSSCYGRLGGADNTLETDIALSAGNVRHANLRSGRVSRVRHARWALDLAVCSGHGSAARTRRRRARVPGRPGLHRRVEPAARQGAVPARLPGRGQRPAVPHRTGDRAGPRRCRAAGDRRYVLAGSGGIPCRRIRGEQGVAEADRRLDRRDPHAWLARHARHGGRSSEGRRIRDPLRGPVGVSDARGRMLAELLAPVSSRQRQFRRLLCATRLRLERR